LVTHTTIKVFLVSLEDTIVQDLHIDSSI